MAGIVVKPRARILHGHDWVFSSEVLKVFGDPADGDVISLKNGKDHLILDAIEQVFCRETPKVFGAALQSMCVIERNDAPVRKAEGLELRNGLLRGTPSPVAIEIKGVKFEVDTLRGHKTGFYLDQKH